MNYDRERRGRHCAICGGPQETFVPIMNGRRWLRCLHCGSVCDTPLLNKTRKKREPRRKKV